MTGSAEPGASGPGAAGPGPTGEGAPGPGRGNGRHTGGRGEGPPEREVVGSLAREAALLAAAVQEWMAANGAPHGGESDPGESDAGESDPGESGAGRASAQAGHEWPCCACPVCRVLGSLRGEHAEVAGHLIDAATSLGAAFRAAWGAWATDPRRRAPEDARPSSGAPSQTSSAGPSRPRIQKINVR
ncbi:hypothetical protein UG55_1006256 [Frankia sp. EI5c]|uniref:hypothetical protein n=1 Tax=Frankia sp. EI5c TaxID=683316 RepID=UPI0007C3A2BE|nr:hypothetical protein [Frankia sp. EI5c]OAA28281.1 hypothetical protein UG55_1006256 [Frankia sp. EI5c]